MISGVNRFVKLLVDKVSDHSCYTISLIMSERFGANFFRDNRERLTKLFAGTAPILITAHARLQRSTTEPYEFTQDSSFWYLTGVNIPEAVLVIDRGKEFLVLPEGSDYLNTFTGSHMTQEIQRASGIKDIVDYKEGNRRIKSRIKKAKHVATLVPPDNYIDVYGMYTNPARQALKKRIKNINPDIKFLDLRGHLASLRMVKKPEEILAIQSAIKITEDSIKQLVKKGFGGYANTFDIQTKLISLFRDKGGEGESFESVVAAGIDTCVIHSQPNRKKMPKRGPLLLDVGAKVDNYCADISRTYFLATVTKRQRQVYEAVLDVYNYALGLLKPGVLIRPYESQIERFMGEKLRGLGLIKNIDRTTVRAYFPHATSHHLGIDVHDVADYDKPLLPGMVLTVEPGIYIPKEALGIRIEDDVLITPEGNQVLSSGLPIMLS